MMRRIGSVVMGEPTDGSGVNHLHVTELFECEVCGAAVSNKELHIQDHETQWSRKVTT